LDGSLVPAIRITYRVAVLNALPARPSFDDFWPLIRLG